MLEAPGQSPIRLIPFSETAFYATALEAEIAVTLIPEGEAKIVLRQGGREFPMKRTSVAESGAA